MVRILPFLISLVLTVYALFSCIQTRSEDVRYLPKVIWVALIVVVPVAGPIAWLLLARNRGASTRGAVPGTRPKAPIRPVAPDDDPDFLASLERYRDPRTTPLPPELRRKGDGTAQPEPGSTDQPENPAAAADASGNGQAAKGKAADAKAPKGQPPNGKAKEKRKSGPGQNDAAKHGGRAADGSAANGPAAAEPPGTGPEPDATPESSTEADGGEGTRKP